MAVGTFTIQELGRVGARTGGRPDGGEGATFEWTSDRTPADLVKGGARACPLQPWTFGGQLRTMRTDYPGAKTPSEQILGPNHTPFTLNGKWDDRYNFDGYAEEELRKFEQMCRRGNLVKFQFEGQAFEGIITEWSFDYIRRWFIRYTFTVSNHDRPQDVNIDDRSPSTARSTVESLDVVDIAINSLVTVTNNESPAAFLNDETNVNTRSTLTDMQAAQQAAADSIRTSGLVDAKPTDQFKRLATQFRTMGAQAVGLINDLIEIRSDVELTAKTALSVLDFESWSRSVRFSSRILLGEGTQAAKDLDERATPDAVRTYRPFKGESLYSISRRFYGTPFAWRFIADRNALQGVDMTGNELLIIPERGEG